MATGLEIAACDVTSTAQVESHPAAVSSWRSELGECKHLDVAISICKYPSHPAVPDLCRGTPSSPCAQKCPGPLAGTEGGRVPPTPHLPSPHCSLWGAELQGEACQPRVRVGGAQVFSSGAWWCPSCPSCSLNSSYSCSIACEKGEVSKQLGLDTISSFWRWIKDLVGFVLFCFVLNLVGIFSVVIF